MALAGAACSPFLLPVDAPGYRFPAAPAKLENRPWSSLQAAEAYAFRQLVDHLAWRKDVQNTDLMHLAGFCRNSLSRWYADGSRLLGTPMEVCEAYRNLWETNCPVQVFDEQKRTPLTKSTAIFQPSEAMHARKTAGVAVPISAPPGLAAPGRGVHRETKLAGTCGQESETKPALPKKVQPASAKPLEVKKQPDPPAVAQSDRSTKEESSSDSESDNAAVAALMRAFEERRSDERDTLTVKQAKLLLASGVDLDGIPRHGTTGKLLSIGSTGHAELLNNLEKGSSKSVEASQCTPCLFYFRNSCDKGITCVYCHLRHKNQRVKRPRLSKKTRDRRRRREKGEEDQEQDEQDEQDEQGSSEDDDGHDDDSPIGNETL